MNKGIRKVRYKKGIRNSLLDRDYPDVNEDKLYQIQVMSVQYFEKPPEELTIRIGSNNEDTGIFDNGILFKLEEYSEIY